MSIWERLIGRNMRREKANQCDRTRRTQVPARPSSASDPAPSPNAATWDELLKILDQRDQPAEYQPGENFVSVRLYNATEIVKICENFLLRPDSVRIQQWSKTSIRIWGLGDRKGTMVSVGCRGAGKYMYSSALQYSEQHLRAAMQVIPETPSPPLRSPYGGQWNEKCPKKGSLEQFVTACKQLVHPACKNTISFSPERRFAAVSKTASGGDYTVTSTYIVVKLGPNLFEWIETKSSG
jgi:hypothetical protein